MWLWTLQGHADVLHLCQRLLPDDCLRLQSHTTLLHVKRFISPRHVEDGLGIYQGHRKKKEAIAFSVCSSADNLRAVFLVASPPL